VDKFSLQAMDWQLTICYQHFVPSETFTLTRRKIVVISEKCPFFAKTISLDSFENGSNQKIELLKVI
jgi:hypothetical protein